MGIGVSVFLIAVGAILAFAVDVQNNTSGIDLDTVGIILMVVGAVGLLVTMFLWGPRERRSEVVEDDPVAGRSRTVYRERL
ncbi:MAG: DUF6458 family protein [Actinomycetota bacterium]|nr:DUF6458 family protein [Actinomycetota bacterium]